MPRVDSIAREHASRIRFLYVNAGPFDPEPYRAKYGNLTFVWDADSTIWNRHDITAWGVAVAMNGEEEILWRGLTFQLTADLLDTLSAGKKVERRPLRYRLEMEVERCFDFGPASMAIGKEDGFYLRIEGRTIGSVIWALLAELYGSRVPVTAIARDNALELYDMTISVECGEEDRHRVLREVLNMLTRSRNIRVREDTHTGENGAPGIIVDYTDYTPI
ncbi:MAG: hypothetical protein RRA94_13260 [Bacteroidota bacterium]|nr:hypothetical protein [Bacteroidota bacterium]